MCLRDLDKNILENKYERILNFFCYANEDEICNHFSENMNGVCNNCEKYKNKNISVNELKKNFNILEQDITENIKDLLDKNFKLIGKKEEETSKDFRLKISLEIFEIIYYNPLFIIKNPLLLVVVCNKIIEFIKTEFNFIESYIKKNIQYIYIFNFMINIYNFITNYIEKNNIQFDENINIKIFEKFLDDYVQMLEIYYTDTIYNKINNTDNNKIDINEIENIEITLEI